MRRIVPIALALLTVASFVSAEDKPSGDAAKFQGVWQGLGGPSKNVPFTITFEGKKAVLAVEIQGEERKFEGEFKLDEKADPKRIDWLKFTNGAGEAVDDNLGIYKLDGDKLVVCSGGPGGERPTKFEAGDEGRPSLSELTRVAASKEKDDAKSAVAPFQGKWKTKLGEMEIAVEFKAAKVTATFTNDEGKEAKLEGEIVVNDAPTPKTIDFVKFKGGDGNEMQDNLGIFTVDKEKDTITICLGGPGNERPTEFKGGDGKSLITLEKVK